MSVSDKYSKVQTGISIPRASMEEIDLVARSWGMDRSTLINTIWREWKQQRNATNTLPEVLKQPPKAA